ncbi:MAG: radical SAM protein [Anaerolineales bacterium]|jgi:putative pyruvate formate lyase activating enzyme
MEHPDQFFISNEGFNPGYLNLYHTGELARRAEEAVASLESCQTCPRRCKANRLLGRVGTCKTKRFAIVSSYFPHMGEENCLRGWRGSGTIFFSQCNLRCAFCQNFDISQTTSGNEVKPQELAGIMLSLQNSGCHNINLVTPDHVVPQILEALVVAVRLGLRLPLVYNTSGYSSQNALAWLDGVVDIYMPDFKFADPENAKLYMQAKDYPQVATDAITEMHRQVGDLCFDEQGLAKHGVLVRHLVMPEDSADSNLVMKTLAKISTNMYLNIMGQYHPAGKVSTENYQQINRRVYPDEIQQSYQHAKQAGLWRFD